MPNFAVKLRERVEEEMNLLENQISNLQKIGQEMLLGLRKWEGSSVWRCLVTDFGGGELGSAEEQLNQCRILWAIFEIFDGVFLF